MADWYGVELDQPLGRHDGTVQGVRSETQLLALKVLLEDLWPMITNPIQSIPLSRFFDLLNSMIYDLKRSVEDDCLIPCYLHPQMIWFFCRDEMWLLSSIVLWIYTNTHLNEHQGRICRFEDLRFCWHQSRKNPVSASAMLTGKFLQIRKVFPTSSLLAEEFLDTLQYKISR